MDFVASVFRVTFSKRRKFLLRLGQSDGRSADEMDSGTANTSTGDDTVLKQPIGGGHGDDTVPKQPIGPAAGNNEPSYDSYEDETLLKQRTGDS